MRSKQLAIMALVWLSTGCAENQALKLLDRADTYLLEENYQGAHVLYSEFLRVYPEDSGTLHAHGSKATIDLLLTTQAEGDRMRQALADWEGALGRLRTELSSREKEIERLGSIRAEIERQFGAREGELKRLREDLAARQKELQAVQAESARAKQELAEWEAALMQLRSDLAGRLKEIERVKRESAERETELSRLRGDLALLLQEIDRLKQLSAEREAQLTVLQKELAVRQTEIAWLQAAREAELKKLRGDLAARETEIERLRKDLGHLRNVDMRPEPKSK